MRFSTMSSLKLTNPHSVLEALNQRPHDVLEVHANKSRANEGWMKVMEKAREFGISIQEPAQSNQRQQNKRRESGGRLGSTFAIVRELQGHSVEELYATDDSRGLWIALDRVQDPHNVGAVFRTAAFFGVKGIIMTQDKSAPLSGTAYDVASGGVETVPHSIQTNLVRVIEKAQKSDMWVLGSSEHATDSLYEIDKDRKWLLVIGNEEKGLRRLTLEKCDMICQIPALGEVSSLNVSVAAGIMMATLTQ